MTATEIAVFQAQPGTIAAKITYAKALAESGLLPANYRKQPANVLWAVEYAEMLRLPPIAAMIGVHVIDGKPTASAGLISGLVRSAGHNLRVGYDAAKMAGWAEITRSDDRSYTFRSEWDLDRAVIAELCTIKDGKPFAVDKNGKSLPWRKFFPSMTKARAITEVARDACEEVLFGLHYTPEELGAEVDEDGVVIGRVVAGPPEQEQRPADRSGGTPDDEPFYVRDAPPPADDGGGNGQRWAEDAKKRAASFKSEAEGTKIWRDAAAEHLAGRIDRDDQDEIQNIVTSRIWKRRMEAAGRILKPLPEDDPWRVKVMEELSSDDDAREAIAELGRIKAAGTMDEDRAGLIARAVVARFPKAAVTEGGEDA